MRVTTKGNGTGQNSQKPAGLSLLPMLPFAMGRREKQRDSVLGSTKGNAGIQRWQIAWRVALAATVAILLPLQASAEPSYGISVFGDLKYKPGFAHFDYVNPAAPKGGRLVTQGTQALDTFDSFNAFILKGDAAQGLQELVYDTLMARAQDEPDSMYGLVAESADVAADRRSVTFKIRPEAKFANGTPVTADDCVFSFKTLKEKGHPGYGVILRSVVSAIALDAQTVRYAFEGDTLRDLPFIVASLPVLPRAFYASHPFEESWLERPLGSGPYAVGDYNQGTSVTYARRADYWAKDLNVNRGRFNFDEIRYEYFRLRTASVQALKAGLLDVREEFTSKEWATGYDIAAVKEGRLLQRILPDHNPSGTQGWWINMRKSKFTDARVREALDHAFDYEWANKNLFYNSYKRTESYFENSKLKATGAPSEAELALLAPYKGKVPASVFGTAPIPPMSDGTGTDRRPMSAAGKLLGEAGFTLKDGQRMMPNGEPFEIEFLIEDPSSERILGRFADNLRRLGITVTLRTVDEAQYQRRIKSFDYDIAGARFTMQLTPGPELASFFGSEQAAIDGSHNLAGIKDPTVDALIQQLALAKSREELQTAGRALDRVLRAGHYWVPNWHKGTHTIAAWNKFGWPAVQPLYDTGIHDTWWYDSDKAAKLTSN